MVNKKILVLGSNGFVGKTIYEELKKSFLVHGISRTSGYDLRNSNILINVIHEFNPDIIINCAAHVGLNYVSEKAAEVISDNCQLIDSMYNSVKKTNKNITIINPIANCAYPGNVKELYTENEFYNGKIHESVFAYGTTRRLLLAYSKAFLLEHKIKTMNFIVPNMYGPFDSTDPNKAHALNALVSKFVKAESKFSNKVDIWGSGSAIREWLYAKDFAILLKKIILKNYILLNNPINVAQKFGLSIKELAIIINKNFNNKFSFDFDLSKPDGAPKKVMNNEKFLNEFKDFTFTNFNEGIKETIKYYKSKIPY